MKKYIVPALFSIAFVILLMSLSSTIRIQNQPQPTPTLSPTPTEVPWQTYRNDKYGFDFQYPSSWSQVDPEGDEFSVGDSQNNCSFSFDTTNKLKVTLPIQSWVNKQIKTNQERIGGPGYYVGTDNSNTTIIDGIKPVIYSTGNEGSDNTSYLFTKNNKIFSLSSYLYMGDSFEQCNQQITQILSTFKFLPDTSTWKTYKNEKLGFELEYPLHYFSEPTTIFHTNDSGGDFVMFESVGEYSSSEFFQMSISAKPKYLTPVTVPKKEGGDVFNNISKRWETSEMIYVMSFAGYDEKNIKMKNDIDKLILSFKTFTSSKQTYYNEQLGFSFHYPLHWKIVQSTDSEIVLINSNENPKYKYQDGEFYPPSDVLLYIGLNSSKLSGYSISKDYYPPLEAGNWRRMVKQGRYINKSGNIGTISYVDDSVTASWLLTNYENEIKYIISTFKFTQ